MLEPGGALAVRLSVRERTKAQVQPAKEGVLDSECKGAAGRKLRRRCVYIPVRGAMSSRQFHTSLMWNQGEFLCMLSGVRGDRNNSGVLPLKMAA